MNQEEMAVKLAEVEQRCKSNTHRINSQTEQLTALNRMATAIEVMATKQTSQAEKIDEIKESVDGLTTKVETIEQKPAKRWDGIVDKIIYGIVGAFVTALGAGIIHLLTVTA